ncbi:WD40-repeat-containing domain protein [Suillus subluteus]|nr:WD40-repeat-containing domain protein [Suillus subluteus]
MGCESGYGEETPKVSPIVGASSSTRRLPQLARSSTPSSSEVVLGSYPTHIAIPRIKSSAIPGKQRAFLSRVVAPPEEIIDLTVDPLDTRVIIPPPTPTRFFRSGVLKIKSVSSKAPSATDVTSAAEPIVLLDSDSDDIVPLRDLISRDGSTVAKSREGPVQASFETLVNGPNEISSVPALVLSPGPGPSRLPLDTHDKPRRVLSAHWNSSLITVSMRGFVESLGMPNLVLQHNLRRPTAPTQESVDDACILHAGDTSVVVLAHAREEKQISYLTSQTSRGTNFRVVDRPWNKTKKGGASVVSTMMQPLMFASGGHDHAVHIWNFSEDFMGVSSTLLAIKHTSMIQSLLPIRDTSHKLISAGADCNVHLWDLSSERVVHTFKTSNSPYHAHKTESPFCTLLEVGHRDLQFELRDHRMVPEHPAERFGFFTTELHGRFIKGDTWSRFFASGSRNGDVRLWDLRNVRKQLASVSCFSNDQVVQVLKTESDLLAFSKRGDVMTLNHT